MKDLIGQSSYNISICSIELSPYFFKQHHPNLPSTSRFSEQGLSFLIDRHIVIHHNFSQHSPIKDTSHIDAILVDFQTRENIFDSEVILCYGGNSTEKVAISNTALQDICWLDLSTYELCIFDDIWNALPGGPDLQVFYVAQGALIWRELRVREFLTTFVVFFDELSIIGLEDFLYHSVLCTHY